MPRPGLPNARGRRSTGGRSSAGLAIEKRLALVFTADLYAEGAATILDALRDRKIHASFFLTGRFLREPGFAAVVKRLRDEGHLVGPHSDEHLLYASWDRPPRLLVTREQFEADLAANLRRLESFGIAPDSVRYFLPPYEHYTEEIAAWTRQGGRILINMTPGTKSNTDYMTDADPRFVPAAQIVASILSAERTDPDGLNGYLLLMHLGAGPKRTPRPPAHGARQAARRAFPARVSVREGR